MDWRREAADKLKIYAAKKTSIDRAAEEIRRLEADTTRIRSATTDSTPVSGGTSTREDMLVNNISLREELQMARRDAIRWVKLVDVALGMLDDEERLVLDRFYIHRAKGNVERLCEALNIEIATAYRRRDSALRRFALALYGVVET